MLPIWDFLHCNSIFVLWQFQQAEGEDDNRAAHATNGLEVSKSEANGWVEYSKIELRSMAIISFGFNTMSIMLEFPDCYDLGKMP
jgi:hypothetical protein